MTAVYPYEDFRSFPVSANNVEYPVWSPDGTMIAYIDTNPGKVNEDSITRSLPGYDQLMIIRSDGSQPQKVGKEIESKEVMYIQGTTESCSQLSGIISPRWSPNQQYILYTQYQWSDEKQDFQYSLFVTSIATDRTYEVLSQQGTFDVLWSLDNSEIIVINSSDHSVLVAKADQDFQQKIIPFPSFPETSSITFISSPNLWEGKLVGFFVLGNYQSQTPSATLWQLDVDLGDWTQFAPLEKGTWIGLSIGREWVVIYGDKMDVLNPATGEKVGAVIYPETLNVFTGLVKVYSQDSEDFVFFYAYDRGSHIYGLWGAPVKSGNTHAELLIKEPILQSTSGQSIIDYSFR